MLLTLPNFPFYFNVFQIILVSLQPNLKSKTKLIYGKSNSDR